MILYTWPTFPYSSSYNIVTLTVLPPNYHIILHMYNIMCVNGSGKIFIACTCMYMHVHVHVYVSIHPYMEGDSNSMYMYHTLCTIVDIVATDGMALLSLA